MFGSKKSTHKCYINKWAFECSKICSCSNLNITVYACITHILHWLVRHSSNHAMEPKTWIQQSSNYEHIIE